MRYLRRPCVFSGEGFSGRILPSFPPLRRTTLNMDDSDKRVNRRVEFVRGRWVVSVLLTRRLPLLLLSLRPSLEWPGRVLQVPLEHDQNVLLLLLLLVVVL